MVGVLVSFVLVVVSAVLARVIYRRIYRRQTAQGARGNVFVGLMLWATVALALGFVYTGVDIATEVDLPEPAPFGTVFCDDGSIARLDGTCPCSQFDLRVRC